MDNVNGKDRFNLGGISTCKQGWRASKRTQKGPSEDKEHGYCHVHVQEGEMAGWG